MSFSSQPSSLPPLSKSKLLNNDACYLMYSGKYNEAIGMLMTALKLAKSTAEENKTHLSNTPCGQPATCDYQEMGTNQAVPIHQEFSRGALGNAPVMEDEQLPSAGPFVYRTPVFIPTLYGNESVATLSFVIMFNLALSHHMKSDEIENSTEVRKALEIAKRLYELTFQMQAQEVQTNLILTSALLNNLSIVHSSLGNAHEAEQCDQLLLSTLLLLVDIGGATPETEGILNGFMDNVMHLIVVESSVASAA